MRFSGTLCGSAEVRIGPEKVADVAAVRHPQRHPHRHRSTGKTVLVDYPLDGIARVAAVDRAGKAPERVAGADRYTAPGSGVGFRGCRAGRPGYRSKGDDHDEDEEAT